MQSMKISNQYLLIPILVLAFSCDMPNENEKLIDTPVDTLDDSPDDTLGNPDPIIGEWEKVNEYSTVHAITNENQNVVDYRIPMTDPIIVEGSIDYRLPYFAHGQTFWEGNYQIILSDAPLLEQENIYLSITEEDSTVRAHFHTSSQSYSNDAFEYEYQGDIGLLSIPSQSLWTPDSSNFVSIACSAAVPQFEITAFDTVELFTSSASIISTEMQLLSFLPPDSLIVALDTLGQGTVIGKWHTTSDSLYLNVSSQYDGYAYSLTQDTLWANTRTYDPSVKSYVDMYEQFSPNTLIDAWIENHTLWVRQ